MQFYHKNTALLVKNIGKIEFNTSLLDGLAEKKLKWTTYEYHDFIVTGKFFQWCIEKMSSKIYTDIRSLRFTIIDREVGYQRMQMYTFKV